MGKYVGNRQIDRDAAQASEMRSYLNSFIKDYDVRRTKRDKRVNELKAAAALEPERFAGANLEVGEFGAVSGDTDRFNAQRTDLSRPGRGTNVKAELFSNDDVLNRFDNERDDPNKAIFDKRFAELANQNVVGGRPTSLPDVGNAGDVGGIKKIPEEELFNPREGFMNEMFGGERSSVDPNFDPATFDQFSIDGRRKQITEGAGKALEEADPRNSFNIGAEQIERTPESLAQDTLTAGLDSILNRINPSGIGSGVALPVTDPNSASATNRVSNNSRYKAVERLGRESLQSKQGVKYTKEFDPSIRDEQRTSYLNLMAVGALHGGAPGANPYTQAAKDRLNFVDRYNQMMSARGIQEEISTPSTGYSKDFGLRSIEELGKNAESDTKRAKRNRDGGGNATEKLGMAGFIGTDGKPINARYTDRGYLRGKSGEAEIGFVPDMPKGLTWEKATDEQKISAVIESLSKNGRAALGSDVDVKRTGGGEYQVTGKDNFKMRIYYRNKQWKAQALGGAEWDHSTFMLNVGRFDDADFREDFEDAPKK